MALVKADASQAQPLCMACPELTAAPDKRLEKCAVEPSAGLLQGGIGLAAQGVASCEGKGISGLPSCRFWG